jgi:hypothetical protein
MDMWAHILTRASQPCHHALATHPVCTLSTHAVLSTQPRPYPPPSEIGKLSRKLAQSVKRRQGCYDEDSVIRFAFSQRQIAVAWERNKD